MSTLFFREAIFSNCAVFSHLRLEHNRRRSRHPSEAVTPIGAAGIEQQTTSNNQHPKRHGLAPCSMFGVGCRERATKITLRPKRDRRMSWLGGDCGSAGAARRGGALSQTECSQREARADMRKL